jgi:hypothetical protein
MKPTLQFHEIPNRRDPRTFRRLGATLPKTDCNFQARVPGDFSGGGGSERKASFRSISHDYFARDARSTFACEATLFGVLVLIVAVPVVEGGRGLMQFLQSIGVL